eukprot:g71905.t1
MLLKDKLKGSAILNSNVYHYNWFHVDTWDNNRPLCDKDTDGYEVSGDLSSVFRRCSERAGPSELVIKGCPVITMSDLKPLLQRPTHLWFHQLQKKDLAYLTEQKTTLSSLHVEAAEDPEDLLELVFYLRLNELGLHGSFKSDLVVRLLSYVGILDVRGIQGWGLADWQRVLRNATGRKLRFHLPTDLATAPRRPPFAKPLSIPEFIGFVQRKAADLINRYDPTASYAIERLQQEILDQQYDPTETLKLIADLRAALFPPKWGLFNDEDLKRYTYLPMHIASLRKSWRDEEEKQGRLPTLSDAQFADILEENRNLIMTLHSDNERVSTHETEVNLNVNRLRPLLQNYTTMSVEGQLQRLRQALSFQKIIVPRSSWDARVNQHIHELRGPLSSPVLPVEPAWRPPTTPSQAPRSLPVWRPARSKLVSWPKRQKLTTGFKLLTWSALEAMCRRGTQAEVLDADDTQMKYPEEALRQLLQTTENGLLAIDASGSKPDPPVELSEAAFRYALHQKKTQVLRSNTVREQKRLYQNTVQDLQKQGYSSTSIHKRLAGWEAAYTDQLAKDDVPALRHSTAMPDAELVERCWAWARAQLRNDADAEEDAKVEADHLKLMTLRKRHREYKLPEYVGSHGTVVSWQRLCDLSKQQREAPTAYHLLEPAHAEYVLRSYLAANDGKVVIQVDAKALYRLRPDLKPSITDQDKKAIISEYFEKLIGGNNQSEQALQDVERAIRDKYADASVTAFIETLQEVLQSKTYITFAFPYGQNYSSEERRNMLRTYWQQLP